MEDGTIRPVYLYTVDADEFVEIEKYTLEEAIAMIHKGEIKDGKTIAALFAWQARKNA